MTVEDRGNRFPTRSAAQLFTPFQRTSEAVDAVQHGTGLGLSIARALARRMGGRPDRGERRAGQGQPVHPAAEGGDSIVSVKVLLVEDEELVGTMVRMNLEGEGYQVAWARDGEEGLAAGLREQFDLILLDIALPGRDGLELLGDLRGGGITTPVLMLTARTDVRVKVDALDRGADDYLAKPFDVSELLARVRALVRRSQSERELPSRPDHPFRRTVRDQPRHPRSPDQRGPGDPLPKRRRR